MTTGARDAASQAPNPQVFASSAPRLCPQPGGRADDARLESSVRRWPCGWRPSAFAAPQSPKPSLFPTSERQVRRSNPTPARGDPGTPSRCLALRPCPAPGYGASSAQRKRWPRSAPPRGRPRRRATVGTRRQFARQRRKVPAQDRTSCVLYFLRSPPFRGRLLPRPGSAKRKAAARRKTRCWSTG